MTTRVRPPGPFPPHGREPRGTIDLGIRLRDHFYTRPFVTGPVRRTLANRLSFIADQPHRLAMAGDLVKMLADTWPLGALVDDARNTWIEGPDPKALAVLIRAAQVVAPAAGFPLSIDRRWPMPDVDWMKTATGDGLFEVIPRGPRDGAPAVAVVLNAALGRADPITLPDVMKVLGDELVERRDEILSSLHIEYSAVEVTTPAPWDDETQQVLADIRMLAPGQTAFERYGLAGLLVGEHVPWEDMLTDAPRGRHGDTLNRTCDALLVPRLGDGGAIEAIGCLVWDAPYQPVYVAAPAVQLLTQLDGQAPLPVLAKKLETSVSVVKEIVTQLVEIGAASA